MVSPVYSFSVPNGNDIVEKALKISGREKLSVLIRTALLEYYNKRTEDSGSLPDCLPKGKRFEEICRASNDLQFPEIGKRLKQLQIIFDANHKHRKSLERLF